MTHLNSSTPFGRRMLGRLVAVTAVLLGLLILGVASAHAASKYEDFGKDAPVTFAAGGTGGGQLVTNPVTGAGYANLWVQNPGSWSTVERKFDYMQHTACSASVAVNAHSATRKVNLEVIDPVTWKYIKLTQAQVSGYQRIVVSGFSYSDKVVVRAVLVSNGSATKQTLDVDDMELYCWYVA